jgi:hypothetical protein
MREARKGSIGIENFGVASAILADVEPGFQPSGKTAAAKMTPAKPAVGASQSGRQDAALYGRLEARHYRRFTS